LQLTTSSLISDATIGFTQSTFPIREDDGQVTICVEISDLQAATEVSLTVSLDGVSSGKAGRKDIILCFPIKFRLPDKLDHSGFN